MFKVNALFVFLQLKRYKSEKDSGVCMHQTRSVQVSLQRFILFAIPVISLVHLNSPECPCKTIRVRANVLLFDICEPPVTDRVSDGIK